ncbi:MAG TPA: glycosyltransferase family 4 protein [Gammaproteobacteria bacterium]|nr:glycosyltransferase family 4 protein [Gammaproteobacteria bacterium]
MNPAALYRPRSVLILVENLPVPFDRRVWQEACALRAAGYLVSVISPTGVGCERTYELIEGVHVHRYRPAPEAMTPAGYVREYATALCKTLLLACRVAFTRGVDVVHACNPPDLFFVIGALFKLFGKRFVFDHHDLNPELYEAKFGRRGFLHRVLLKLEYLSFRLADAVLATNQSYRQVALTRGRVDPRRVFVVRSGPNLACLRSVPPDVGLKCGRRFLVGYVGVMGAQEGIDCLLHAVHHIVHDLKRTDIHFALVGGGTSLAEMRELAARLRVDSYVTFTNRVADDVLLRVLSTADVCVNPDRANEMNDKSTMNKIMEYMALGKPIVQFDLKEGRYSAQQAAVYVRPGDTIDFGEQIVALLDDPERRKRMGEFGYERVVKELEWRRQIRHLLAAYDGLWPHDAEIRHETPIP